MIKFTRDALSRTKAGERIDNQLELLKHEEVLQKKKRIAEGYERGWIVIGQDRPIFVRSRWEANLICYFQWLKETGVIKNWFYESETFWFDGVRRGTNNYKPDIKIIEHDGGEYYIEVKGYFTRKDLTKFKRMAKYHPNVRIKILSSDKGFAQIHKDFPDFSFEKCRSYDMISESSSMFKGWGQPFKKKEEIQSLIPLPMKKPKSKKI